MVAEPRELTPQQQATQAGVTAYFSDALQPEKRDAFDNLFVASKKQWREEVTKKLENDPKFGNEAARIKKLEELEAVLDKQIIQRARDGSLSSNSKSPQNPEQDQKEKGIFNFFVEAIDGIAGWFGAVASWIWKAVKAFMPEAVSTWVSGLVEKFSPTTPEMKNEAIAAGVATSLAKPITVGGVNFTLDQNARNQLYDQLRLRDISHAVGSTSTVDLLKYDSGYVVFKVTGADKKEYVVRGSLREVEQSGKTLYTLSNMDIAAKKISDKSSPQWISVNEVNEIAGLDFISNGQILNDDNKIVTGVTNTDEKSLASFLSEVAGRGAKKAGYTPLSSYDESELGIKSKSVDLVPDIGPQANNHSRIPVSGPVHTSNSDLGDLSPLGPGVSGAQRQV
ncbi:MAG: hypothetical protein KGI29_01885 [Pseudomonadota bacterium]|nr:hypothetical protein [Pseudomonadota bacterium]MDE3037623.1 hypothetical protein [Pseudomonadota bacterium]